MSSLAGRRGRHVGFAEVGFGVNRVVIDLSGDRQAVYAKSVLVHVTNTVRLHVPEALSQ
jgi:hypothetical protein